MDKSWIKTLLLISSLSLAVAALIFIGLSMWGKQRNTSYLPIGLGCGVLGNLFQVIRNRMDTKKW